MAYADWVDLEIDGQHGHPPSVPAFVEIVRNRAGWWWQLENEGGKDSQNATAKRIPVSKTMIGISVQLHLQ